LRSTIFKWSFFMKKNVLALSITAAVVSFGFAGGAQAMTGALSGAATSSSLALNGDGVGHMLLVPYFTAQDKNATLINIVNTDVVNGKAVKVRFRGAANSDDIYDFQVFLSPGDVWTANVSKGADGRAQLTTADASCTKPAKAVLNATPFVTGRLDSTLTADQKANGTREGYVEIFNMGDIPKGKFVDAGTYTAGTAAGQATGGTGTNKDDNALYTAIKHVSKVAPCSGDAWTYLDTNNLTYGTANAAATSSYAGLTAPTTGLMANWTIINVVGAAAWSGEAVAVQSVVTATGAATTGNVVYWPQTGDAVGIPTINSYTADPLLRSANVSKYDPTGAAYAADTTPAVTAGYYDLPDFSTPYTQTAAPAAVTAQVQAKSVTGAIASTSTTNEFLTDTAIVASTDWVFSMPTRRYSVAFDYAATISGTDDGRRFTDINGDAFATGYFLQQNTLVSSSTNNNGRQVCVKGITTTPYDREETGVASVTTVVVSPSTPADPLSFCGEAAVLSINNGGIQTAGTGALKASVAVKDLDVTFRDGWMKISTPAPALTAGDKMGLPLVGASFERAWAGTQSFGVTSAHRMTRAVAP
jgi:hypothetical protein